MMSERDRLIIKTEESMQIDDIVILARWLDVMGEWAESDEYGHKMHVVLNHCDEPYCTDAPRDGDFCWENLVSANMDWREVLDGYRDNPSSKWYVINDDYIQVNMWSLAGFYDMRNALRKAIADYYANR